MFEEKKEKDNISEASIDITEFQENGENKEKEEEIGTDITKVAIFSQKSELLTKILDAKVPTREENIELVNQAKKGDERAKEDVMVRNGKLVLSVIKKYYPTYILNEDLLQEGLIGVQKAIDMYDGKYNTAFSTYAVWWIRQNINTYLTNNDKLIRLPAPVIDKIAKVKKLEKVHLNAGIEPPTIEEIARSLEISETEAKELKSCAEPIISLEMQLNDAEDLTVGDLIPDGDSDVSEKVLSTVMKEQLQNILKETLSERELDIMKMRFGFEPYEQHSLEEIGKKYSITKERVRQIEKKCLKQLKHPKRKKQIAELYDL